MNKLIVLKWLSLATAVTIINIIISYILDYSYVQQIHNNPIYRIFIIGVCGTSAIIFFFIMFIDVIRNKLLLKRPLWIFSFIIFTFIPALMYYWINYKVRNNNEL